MYCIVLGEVQLYSNNKRLNNTIGELVLQVNKLEHAEPNATSPGQVDSHRHLKKSFCGSESPEIAGRNGDSLRVERRGWP